MRRCVLVAIATYIALSPYCAPAIAATSTIAGTLALLSRDANLRDLFRAAKRATPGKPGKPFKLPRDVLGLVDNQIETLNRMEGPRFEPLTDRIRDIASPGVREGTLQGSGEELARLNAAKESRRAAIGGAQKTYDRLTQLQDAYDASSTAAYTMRVELEKLLDHSPVVFMDAVTGNQLSLTMLDLAISIEPALAMRATMLRSVRDKYATAIASAKRDLKSFEESVAVGSWLFPTPSLSAMDIPRPEQVTGSDPTGRSVVTDRVMSNTNRAMTAAEKQRAKAEQIGRYNAQIAAFQNLLGLLAASGQVSKTNADNAPSHSDIYINIQQNSFYRLDDEVWKPDGAPTGHQPQGEHRLP